MSGGLSSPFYAPDHHTVCCSLVRHRAVFGSEIKNRASVATFPFPPLSRFWLSLVSHCTSRTARCLPFCEASSQRQGDGQRFQKKAMKTSNSVIEASAPANGRPSSVSKTRVGKQPEFVRHCANRRLSTEAVLNCLQTRLPRQYQLAEVVGKWVWLDISPAGKPNLAGWLWALGFHWNQRQTILAEFECSGVSAVQFAQRTGLKYSTLAGWLQR